MPHRPPRRALGAVAAALAACLAAAPAPSAADWLVTREGARIETDGPWELRGKLVVFRQPGGELASMRAAELDLEASRRATAEPPAAPPEPPPAPEPAAPRQPALVLTDADVAHVGPRPAEETGTDEEVAGGEAVERLAVVSWDEAAAEDGVAVVGRVRNQSSEALTAMAVTVTLLDSEGAHLASERAQLLISTLAPGASTSFRADFPSVWAFFDVRFETDGFALASRDAEEAPPPSIPGAPDGR